MGEAELHIEKAQLYIHSHFIFYGGAATPELAEQLRDEVETLWNEPAVQLAFDKTIYTVNFRITAEVQHGMLDVDIYQNVDPKNNYFRIEPFILGNISSIAALNLLTMQQ